MIILYSEWSAEKQKRSCPQKLFILDNFYRIANTYNYVHRVIISFARYRVKWACRRVARWRRRRACSGWRRCSTPSTRSTLTGICCPTRPSVPSSSTPAAATPTHSTRAWSLSAPTWTRWASACALPRVYTRSLAFFSPSSLSTPDATRGRAGTLALFLLTSRPAAAALFQRARCSSPLSVILPTLSPLSSTRAELLLYTSSSAAAAAAAAALLLSSPRRFSLHASFRFNEPSITLALDELARENGRPRRIVSHRLLQASALAFFVASRPNTELL